MTISLLKNESIFGDNWFAVVVYELMIPWLVTTKHALCKTYTLRHQTPTQFIPLTNWNTFPLQSRKPETTTAKPQQLKPCSYPNHGFA